MYETAETPRIRSKKQKATLHIVVRRASFDGGIGGLERAAADQAVRLCEAGIDLCMHTPSDVPKEIRSRTEPWPRWNAGPGAPTFGPAYLAWMRGVASGLRDCTSTHDVIYFHGASVGSLQWYKATYPASILNPHGMEEFGPAGVIRQIGRAPLRLALRSGAAKASKVIATDNALRAAVTANLRVQPKNVAVIPNGVDAIRLDMLATRGRPDLDVSTLDIVSVGRLVPNKGYDLLAMALKRLTTSSKDKVSWTHFGAGSESQRIKKILAGVREVKFLHREHQSDEIVQAAIANCWVFVQPSRNEGSSLTVLEAMAHGAIVVGTPVGGIPDKIVDGRTGFLAESVSADAIMSAIVKARSCDRGRISQSARAFVNSKFGAAATTRQLVELLNEVGDGAW